MRQSSAPPPLIRYCNQANQASPQNLNLLKFDTADRRLASKLRYKKFLLPSVFHSVPNYKLSGKLSDLSFLLQRPHEILLQSITRLAIIISPQLSTLNFGISAGSNMDDSPDRIGPDVSPKVTFSDKLRGVVRALSTK